MTKEDDVDYVISAAELDRLLSRAVEIGVQRGYAAIGQTKESLSQNKAFQIYGKARVKNWVDAGLITPSKGGNGKTSTVYYSAARLMELKASNEIVIRKIYEHE